MKNNQIIFIVLAVIAVAFSRFLVPASLPNFTPMGAIALFSGALITNKRLAFIIPLMALFVSDLFVGFHDTMPYVYLGFVLIIGIGMWLKPRLNAKMVFGSLLGSILFFLITNMGYWINTDPTHSLSGLTQSYIDGIPFFRNSILGDLFFNGVLFGAYSLFAIMNKKTNTNTEFTKV